MTEQTINDRIARLEAIEEIRKLKAAYAKHCDNNYDVDRIVALFTEDCYRGGRRPRRISQP